MLTTALWWKPLSLHLSGTNDDVADARGGRTDLQEKA